MSDQKNNDNICRPSTNEPVLCSAGCGFYGRPETQGMCSKCFKENVAMKAKLENNTEKVEKPNEDKAEVNPAQDKMDTKLDTPVGSPSKMVTSAANTPSATPSPSKKKSTTRCHICRKKVGLTGFKCRCGGYFCGLHRYSDKHACEFDFKSRAKQAIEKANPTVVAKKVDAI